LPWVSLWSRVHLLPAPWCPSLPPPKLAPQLLRLDALRSRPRHQLPVTRRRLPASRTTSSPGCLKLASRRSSCTSSAPCHVEPARAPASPRSCPSALSPLRSACPSTSPPRARVSMAVPSRCFSRRRPSSCYAVSSLQPRSTPSPALRASASWVRTCSKLQSAYVQSRISSV
jgi:hypothetical protein